MLRLARKRTFNLAKKLTHLTFRQRIAGRCRPLMSMKLYSVGIPNRGINEVKFISMKKAALFF